MVKVQNDLTGQKFGRLTVIKQAEDYITPQGNHHSQWLCKCDCGNDVITLGSRLKNKQCQSCGCIQIEKNIQRWKKYNTYNLNGEYGIGYLDDGTEFYFDLEDYDKIKDIRWKKDKDGYIVTSYQDKETKKTKGIKMHRLIMNYPESMFVDHIKTEDRNDNRKNNLRICTDYENRMNHRVAKNNTSGATGVHWHKQSQKWRAVIYYNGKKIDIGSYHTFEEAKNARLKAELNYYGEFSYNKDKII